MALGIVIVMAIFTWVMWQMAQQVFVMTDVMTELNGSFQLMVVDMSAMRDNTTTMADDIHVMIGMMDTMNQAMQAMTVNVGRMTVDIGRATYAFSNPMSYMFGGNSPFPF